MHILPVIDLQGGVVVHGVGGRREQYQPVRGALCANAEPLAVARAFREHFDLSELYLADLDAIAGAAPAVALYDHLARDGFRLWVDAGLRDETQVQPLAGVHRLIAGSETLEGPDALRRLVEREGERLVFSLDLRAGEALASTAWGAEHRDPWSVANGAVACGVTRMIVLDLARVGTGEGTSTNHLLADVRAAYPSIEVYAGGGVRGREDLARLKRLGAHGALVATALHDLRLSRADLESL